MVEMAHREKVTVKGTCVGHDAIRHSDWFGISSQTVSSPPSPFSLDWHSTLVSFRDFRANSRNGKSDESFGFHDRKEGGGYGWLSHASMRIPEIHGTGH